MPVDHERSRVGGTPGRSDASGFAELPRLEFDQLLRQLVDRAQEVMTTQDRLRGLLRATQAIIGDLTLPVALRRIVEAARDLVGARYAALGVFAADGQYAEVVHAGMSADLLAQLGRSAGSAGPGAAAPSGVLRLPIRVREELFGNLYLARSGRGRFTEEDEELAAALAVTAGVVIENARLYAAAQARQDWLRASAAITRRLLSTGPADPLRLIADSCREIASADLVTVVLPTEDGTDLRVEIAVGSVDVGELLGLRMRVDDSLSGRVFTSGLPLRVSYPYEHPRLVPLELETVDLGPVLVVPLRGSQRMHGVLTAGRIRGRVEFSAEDLDMAAGFANQAGVAIELAQARAEQQRAAMLDERDRIAADLHDHVIQRLFATGLSLQGVATGLAGDRHRDRVLTAIADLDDTIGQIRTSIFQLQQTTRGQAPGVRTQLLDVATDLTPALGFEPSVRFHGVLEGRLAAAVTGDLLAALRESLSNVARHAGAHRTTITVTATDELLTLQVTDDGCGIGVGRLPRCSGLLNLRRRAEQHCGGLTIAPAEPTGTRLTWSIPI